MTKEFLNDETSLSVFKIVTTIINQANAIEGFKTLEIDQQHRVLEFVSAHMNFVYNPNDEAKKETFFEKLGEVQKYEHLKVIAFKCSLKVLVG